MGITFQSGTAQRVMGTMLFVPVVAAFILSQHAAQWIFLAFSLIMVWEFCAMLQLTRAVRVLLLLEFILFALPAGLFARFEMLAGGPLLPTMLALGGLVVVFIGAATRNSLATGFVALLILCILSGRELLGVGGGHHLVLGLAVIVAVCDIAAYFVGRRIGGWRLAPAISPKKTLSGAAGGIIGAVIASVILLEMVGAGAGRAIIAGVIIAVLAQAGDLLESALKRRMQVKDSGRLIPGHGGFLDRFDGYLLTLPALCIYNLVL